MFYEQCSVGLAILRDETEVNKNVGIAHPIQANSLMINESKIW